MSGFDIRSENSQMGLTGRLKNPVFCSGGLFLDSSTIPSSIVSTTSGEGGFSGCSVRARRKRWEFLCLSLSIKGKDGAANNNSSERTAASGETEMVKVGNGMRVRLRGRGAVNTTKHLWAGAVAAMVSRTCLAPLERLKLEYIVRGEKRNLVELVHKIAKTQGVRGFWKGNFVNILRTAPFKAINFCAYDTYRKQLLILFGNEETTNSERLVAGAAAGITATVLCLPLDTVRNNL
ncbi:mitochondrial substrate carrier family protein [Striga asiatica]|uniref:Mitochondrial substrate carrier family protein n=1 Tax=Striga asiatica TaxID=4170 RepID=A0A5A7REY9_STRAF|nr:mitochondrial substrate carrier family protein [Striga asiatica]